MSIGAGGHKSTREPAKPGACRLDHRKGRGTAGFADSQNSAAAGASRAREESAQVVLSGAPLCAGSERGLGSHHAIALGDPRVARSDPQRNGQVPFGGNHVSLYVTFELGGLE